MTPVSTSSVAPFDWLPNEILLEILKFAMDHHTPFVLDDYYLSLNSGKAKESPSRPPQYAHLNDWRIINSINQRVRRVGKVAFFSAKTFALDIWASDQLQSSPFTWFGSASNQEIALQYIRSIILVVPIWDTEAAFLRLPNTLTIFKRLKCSKILLTYEPSCLVDCIYKAERVDVPKEIKQLLGNKGVTDKMMPELHACKGKGYVNWPNYLKLLAKHISNLAGQNRHCGN